MHSAELLTSPIMQQADTPKNTNGLLQCPIGTACELRVINLEQMFCECIPDERGHICPNALPFGGGTYCRALWKNDRGKV